MPATTIMELESGSAWRAQWRAAFFRDAQFHVDTGVRESGRRIVPHQFPKRDIPYAEDMGRRAREFTVRGYIIVYPRDNDGDDLQKRNYLPARDRLMAALEAEGPALLQLPLLGAMKVAVVRYRITEESKYGGFCTFDMTFVEYGKAPAEGRREGSDVVINRAAELQAAVRSAVENILKLQGAADPPPAAATNDAALTS